MSLAEPSSLGGFRGQFVPADLASPARALARHLQGRPVEEQGAWLRQRGEGIDNPIHPADYHDSFRSFVGLRATFRLTADSKLLIIFADTFDSIDPLEQEIYTIGWDWTGSHPAQPS